MTLNFVFYTRCAKTKSVDRDGLQASHAINGTGVPYVVEGLLGLSCAPHSHTPEY